MSKKINWSKDEGGTYTSECSTISVYEADGEFVMFDSVEGEERHYKTLVDAMDGGGKRFLTTRYGQFLPFLRTMEKAEKSKLTHVVDGWLEL